MIYPGANAPGFNGGGVSGGSNRMIEIMVSGAERLLLHDCWSGLRDYSFATDDSYNPTHAAPHPAAHAAAAAASSHPATLAATHSAASPRRTCRSIQLRCGPVLHLGWGETAMVLQDPPHLRPADTTASPRRPVQLRGWVRELASRLVGPQEGVVLSGSRQRLPEPRWRVRPISPHR